MCVCVYFPDPPSTYERLPIFLLDDTPFQRVTGRFVFLPVDHGPNHQPNLNCSKKKKKLQLSSAICQKKTKISQEFPRSIGHRTHTKHAVTSKHFPSVSSTSRKQCRIRGKTSASTSTSARSTSVSKTVVRKVGEMRCHWEITGNVV